jgi:hypothetical protein
MSETTNFTFAKGSAVTFAGSRASGTASLTGKTLAMYVGAQNARRGAASPPLTVTPTVTSATDFSASLTSAQTTSLGVGEHPYSVWIIDSGSEDEIARGVFKITSSARG